MCFRTSNILICCAGVHKNCMSLGKFKSCQIRIVLGTFALEMKSLHGFLHYCWSFKCCPGSKVSWKEADKRQEIGRKKLIKGKGGGEMRKIPSPYSVCEVDFKKKMKQPTALCVLFLVSIEKCLLFAAIFLAPFGNIFAFFPVLFLSVSFSLSFFSPHSIICCHCH